MFVLGQETLLVGVFALFLHFEKSGISQISLVWRGTFDKKRGKLRTAIARDDFCPALNVSTVLTPCENMFFPVISVFHQHGTIAGYNLLIYFTTIIIKYPRVTIFYYF